MDTVTLWPQGKELIHKYRYLLLILLAGLLLMSLPEKEIPTAPVQENSVPQEKTLQEDLEQILSKIKGAGKVQVLLTEFRGTETVYQEDTDRADTSDRSDTVILTGSVTTLDQARPNFEKFENLYGIHYIIPENATFATAIGAGLYSLQTEPLA